MLKYEIIERDIQEKIENGFYRPNDKLPMEKEMCETYGVSKITVKRAMDSLVAKGLILKRRGAGSFVQDINLKDHTNTFKNVAGDLNEMNDENSAYDGAISSKIHTFEVIVPPENVAQELRIEKSSFTYHILRTRYVQEKPIVTEETYMPIEVIPGLRQEHLEGSIYQYIRDELGHKVYSAHRTLRAKMPNAEMKEYLNLEQDEPLFEVEQVGFLDDGRRFEYSISDHPGNSYEFFTVSFS